MDCKQIDERLVDYLYEELDSSQVTAFEAHLRRCPNCSADLEAYQHTRGLVADLDEIDPPAEIDRLLIDEAERRAPAAGGALGWGERLRMMLRPLMWNPALSAAALLVLVLGVSFFLYRKGALPERFDGADSATIVSDQVGIVPTAGEAAAPAGGQLEHRNDEAPAQAIARSPLADSEDGNEVANAPLKALGPKFKQNLKKRANKEALADAKREVLSRVGGASGGRSADKTAEPRVQMQQPQADLGYGGAAKYGRGKRDRPPAAKPATVARAAKPAPADYRPASTRRKRARRQAANISDVGGGSSVWSPKRRAASSGKDQDAIDDRNREGRREEKQASQAKGKAGDLSTSTAQQVRRKADPAREAFLAGAEAVRARRCRTAFGAFNSAISRQPRLISAVVAQLGPCLEALNKTKGYSQLAGAVARETNRQKTAIAARKAEQRKRAKKKASKRKSTAAPSSVAK